MCYTSMTTLLHQNICLLYKVMWPYLDFLFLQWQFALIWSLFHHTRNGKDHTAWGICWFRLNWCKVISSERFTFQKEKTETKNISTFPQTHMYNTYFTIFKNISCIWNKITNICMHIIQKNALSSLTKKEKLKKHDLQIRFADRMDKELAFFGMEYKDVSCSSTCKHSFIHMILLKSPTFEENMLPLP